MPMDELELIDNYQYKRGYEDGYKDSHERGAIRRKGKWILLKTYYNVNEEPYMNKYQCSECGKSDIHCPKIKVSYCWNCGARMDGGKE